MEQASAGSSLGDDTAQHYASLDPASMMREIQMQEGQIERLQSEFDVS